MKIAMKCVEKIATGVLNVTLFALVAIGVLVVGSILPIFGSNRVFVVQSGSMEPAIPTGSVILVGVAPSYGMGDIVTWQPARGGTPITHRIVRILPEEGGVGARYQTKGDANQADDEVIVESQILGSVKFSLPYLGYPVSFAKQPLGFVLLILIPSLLIIFDEILNLKREFAKRAYQKKERNKTSPLPDPSPSNSPTRFPEAKDLGSPNFLERV